MVVVLLILLIMFLNSYGIYTYWEFFIEIINENKYNYLIIILLWEFLLILLIVHFFYNKPIKEIKHFIQKLYSGQLKWEKIDISKSVNSNLNIISNNIVDILHRLRNIKDEFIHGKSIKWEVELAKEIQWRTFNKKLVDVPSLNVVVNSKPAWEIGWDSYDIIKNWENYYIYVWDATGHWVWAWFIMIMVNALTAWFSKVYIKWSQILAWTNEILKPRVKANLLMTVLMLRWNEEQKKMFMTWAWHEYLMIYKQSTKKCYKVKSWGVALWMIKDISKIIKEKWIQFDVWDIIVLYTDWITEAINKPKRDWTESMFWEDRLISAIEKAPNMKGKTYKSANSIYNNITIMLSQFMWYKPIQLDDVTLAVVQYKTEDYNIEDDYNTTLPPDVITEWNWES